MIFKKLKRNENKIKPRRRKRKIFVTIGLQLILLFSKVRCSSSQSSSPNFGNQEVHGKVTSDRDFNSFENNDRQVILIGRDSSRTSSNVPSNIGRYRQSPSNFPTPSSGLGGRPSRPLYGPKYRPAPKVVDSGLGAPAGAGNRGGPAEFDDQCPVPNKKQSQELKTFDYNYPSNDPKKKKQSSEDQWLIDEQNKAGVDELPDSSQFIYKLETKTARKALKNVWKNSEAKKEVLAGLDTMNKGELLPRNQKNFKGFKTLKEIKLTDTRMLIQPGQNGGPDQIVAIFMRRDLDNIASIFKNKYN